MPAERYYLDQDYLEGKLLILDGKEDHHLRHVMRSRSGDQLEIVNGRGSLGSAIISKFNKHDTEVLIKEVIFQDKLETQNILIQAIPRLNRLETIVEKGTELGMTHLCLLPSSLSERKELSESQIQRLRLIAIAAMKQCGRLYLPEISTISPIDQWEVNEKLPLYFGDLNPQAPKLRDIAKDPTGFIFVTGPESGFTDKEIQQLRSLGGIGVKLHTNILRTDTASIAALSLLSD